MQTAKMINLVRGLKHTIISLALILGIVSATQAATTGFNQVAGTYDYNTAGNWVGNTINGIWDASLTNTAAQTVTFGADTALTTGLTFNYAGNNALTLKASASGTKTVTLAGDIGLNTGGGTSANVTLGDASNHLNVDLGGATRTLTVAASRTLTFTDVVSNGGITKAGAGTLTLSAANTYTSGTTISAGTLIVGNANALGTLGTITLGDASSGANAIMLLNNVNSGFSRPITVSNNGTGTVTLGSGTSNKNNPTFTGAITLNRNVTFNTNNGSIDGGISGTGDVTITASGGWAVRLGGYNNSGAANTFAGNIYIISGSILSIGAGGWKPTANLVPDSSIMDVLGTLNVDKGAGNNETIGALTGNGTVSIGSASLTVGGGTFTGSATFSGTIKDAGAFVKTGTGTQTLSGANTYRGGTTISNGTLRLGVFNAITTNGAMTVAGGIYDLGGFVNVTNAAVTMSGGAISNGILTASSYVLSGGTSYAPLAGNASLIKNGVGTATLVAANTYSGVTMVSNGTLFVDGSLASSSTVTVESGATLGGSGTVNGAVSVASGGILTAGGLGTIGKFSLTNSVTLNSSVLRFDLINADTAGITYDQIAIINLVANGANVIALNSASGTITNGTYTLMTYAGKTGEGTFVFQNGSTTYGNFSLATSDTNVILTVSADTAFGILWKGTVNGLWDTTTANWTNTATATTTYYFDSEHVTFNDTATATTIGGGTVTPGSMTFNNTAKSYTVSNSIAGSGPVSKSGTGTLTLIGASTYTGKTTLNAGTLSINSIANAGSASALGAPAGANGTIDLYNGATLQYTGGVNTPTTDRVINLAGSGGTVILKFYSPDGGTLTLNGNVTSTATGATTLTTTYNNNGNFIFNGAIADSPGGATSLSLNAGGGGTSATTLGNANNSYSGKTTVGRNTLNFSSIKNVNGGNSSLGAPTTPANGTIDLGTGAAVTLNYTGAGDTTDRILNMLGSLGLGSSGGLLRFTSDLTAVSGNKTITLGNNVQLDGAISNPTGSGSISLSISNGNGASTLTSASNSFSGTITIANANLYIASIPNGGAITTASGGGQQGTLIYTGTGGTNNRPVQLNGSAGTTINQSGSGLLKFTGALTAITAGSNPLTLKGSTTGSGEFNGAIGNGSGIVSLTKDGAGIWILSGTNTYSGATTVNGGTLRAGIASAAGYGAFGTNSAVTLANAAGVVLDLNGFNTVIGSLAGAGPNGSVTLGSATLTIGTNNTSTTFGGVISGTGNLVKVGTSTNTLSGVNLYTGTTTVSKGTLRTTVINCLSDDSSVSIDTNAKMFLDFTGSDTVKSLKLGGKAMPKGVYGVSGLEPSYFSGNNGTLTVTTGPATGTLVQFF